jgi:hypothetical protein
MRIFAVTDVTRLDPKVSPVVPPPPVAPPTPAVYLGALYDGLQDALSRRHSWPSWQPDRWELLLFRILFPSPMYPKKLRDRDRGYFASYWESITAPRHSRSLIWVLALIRRLAPVRRCFLPVSEYTTVKHPGARASILAVGLCSTPPASSAYLL